MQIPLIIGRNSNGEYQQIDLAEIPLLMISYCEDAQLRNIFKALQTISYPFQSNNYYIASLRKCIQWEINIENAYLHYKDEPDNGNIPNKQKLLKLLNDEIFRRERILKKKKISDFKKYATLNTWNKDKLTYQFIIVDDIWDIIVSKPKSLGLSLMRIILYGPQVGIHTIFTGKISFRNLLEQLININPIISKELQKKFGIPEPKRINNLGNELILTAENLVFYKKAGLMEMDKLYLSGNYQ